MLLRGDGTMLESLLPGADAMAPWIAAWWDRIAQDSTGPIDHADAMDAVNPLYIPRNHLVEEALDAAEAGDLAPWLQLIGVVRHTHAGRSEEHTSEIQSLMRILYAVFRFKTK